MDCRYRNRRWKIVYFYIGAIGHVRKRIPGLYGENAREKKLKKMKEKIFYEKIRHVPGRRSVQKTEDEKSKPVPVPNIEDPLKYDTSSTYVSFKYLPRYRLRTYFQFLL